MKHWLQCCGVTVKMLRKKTKRRRGTLSQISINIRDYNFNGYLVPPSSVLCIPKGHTYPNEEQLICYLAPSSLSRDRRIEMKKNFQALTLNG